MIEKATDKFERELIKMPEKKACFRHNEYRADCVDCKSLHSSRVKIVADYATGLAYKTVYDNWKEYMDRVRKPFPEGVSVTEKNLIEDEYVKQASELLKEEKYPFAVGSDKLCVAAWRQAIKELSVLLFDGYACWAKPEKKEGKRKRKAYVLWY